MTSTRRRPCQWMLPRWPPKPHQMWEDVKGHLSRYYVREGHPDDEYAAWAEGELHTDQWSLTPTASRGCRVWGGVDSVPDAMWEDLKGHLHGTMLGKATSDDAYPLGMRVNAMRSEKWPPRPHRVGAEHGVGRQRVGCVERSPYTVLCSSSCTRIICDS